MPSRSNWLLALLSVPWLLAANLLAADPANAGGGNARGRALYLKHCMLCHQITGVGMPGSIPPLAGSDFLAQQTERSIRAVVEGMSGEITVNGRRYNGSMPPAILNDNEAADVLTFARQSWGNTGIAITPEQVKSVRAKSAYPTYEALIAANAFAPLPPAPDGFTLRVVGNMPTHPTRILKHPLRGEVWALGNGGEVWALNSTNGSARQVLWPRSYIDLSRGEAVTYGMTFDRSGRFYVVLNQRYEKGPLVTNEVTIFRTATFDDGAPRELKPWFKTAYPWGIGPFNHCVGHIAQGPDGFLYVNSGSRTDGNEPGDSDRYARTGEHETTACLWRLDPQQDNPQLEIYARGFRNAYGFCWDDRGRMIATDNGPDAHMPEELNIVERGKHYGFPFQYGDSREKPYPHTPETPAGLSFTLPVVNIGPNGGFNGKQISTFHPHSSPAGIVYLGEGFPERYRDSYFVVRFGNLLKQDPDVGFDLLHVKFQGESTPQRAQITTLLTPLPRPIDIVRGGPGVLYIAEYSRTTNNAGSLGFAGRLLELKVSPPVAPQE